MVGDEEKHSYQLKLTGAATFLRLPILAEKLNQLPGDAELHVCLDKVWYIDHACFELLMNWAKAHVADGGTLIMDWDQLHGAFHSDTVPDKESTTIAASSTEAEAEPTVSSTVRAVISGEKVPDDKKGADYSTTGLRELTSE